MKEENQEILLERYHLVKNRISEISKEENENIYASFFRDTALFLLKLSQILEKNQTGTLQTRTIEEAREDQEELYRFIRPENYKTGMANPSAAIEAFGEKAGRILTLFMAELHSGIGYVFEEKQLEFTILMELYVELYICFMGDTKPDLQEANQTVYWYFYDYSSVFTENQVTALVEPNTGLYRDILLNADLEDLSYLYRYGFYIGENETRVAEFLNTLSQEEIQSMADTYTEGYRIGFEITGKDLSKKKTVSIHYPVGFERMVRCAYKNFEKMGLSVTISREPFSTFYGFGGNRGVYASSLNRQFEYDHKEDKAFYLDKASVEYRLEMMRNAFSRHQEAAKGHAGPAVIETFGEQPFSPTENPDRICYSDSQQELSVYQMSEAGQITNHFIPGEERSFTIIAYPIPEIGPQFPEIFAETVKINTLDYQEYQRMQQCLIDVLDTATRVHVKGCNGNRTDITVSLYPLTNPSEQTIFENCVADVNIPVGEVFTSPVLKGTTGILHVSEVFLNGLQFLDLEFEFQDGWISSYRCGNFEDEEKGKTYIKDNILAHHDSLPLGEFAIGTNTTAYQMAKKYQIADKLPILIAEKTGPHFAVGDTCYSHAEETAVFNPDGKEIVARDNECSLQRKEDMQKAYLNCHTDITVPFEELGHIKAIREDGSEVTLIENGRFLVPGTESLNKPLEEK